MGNKKSTQVEPTAVDNESEGYGNAYKFEPDFTGPVKKRSCTDVICLGLFFLRIFRGDGCTEKHILLYLLYVLKHCPRKITFFISQDRESNQGRKKQEGISVIRYVTKA